MCDPISAGLAIGAGVLNYAGQQQMANAQAAANAQGRELAIQNQRLQIQALNNQEDEDRREASDAIMRSSQEAEAVAATARVASGEAGVSGLSVDALMGDIVMQETANRRTILDTQDNRQRQRQLDREGLGITTQSQINQMPIPEYPSFFGTFLQTGGSIYGQYKQDQYFKSISK